MNELMITSLYVLAGICVYAAFRHFSIGLYRPYNRTQLLFAALCLLIVLFAVFHAWSLEANDVPEFVRALKWSLSIPFLFFALFPWFFALYTGNYPRYFLIGLSVLFTVLSVVNLIMPYSLQYDRLDGIQILHLPWGEDVTRGVGHNSPWVFFPIAGIVAEFVYAFYALGGVYLRQHRATDLSLMFALLLFLIGTIVGTLARLSVIDFVELGPFGFLTMVIVMSMALTYDTQHRLRTSERHFRSLFDNSPTGMVAVDPKDGSIILANRAMLAMVGYSLEEIKHKHLAEFISPDERDESRQRYERLVSCITSGLDSQLNSEWQLLRKDGSSLLAELFVTSLKDEHGKAIQLIATVINITERKKAQDALRESDMRFRAIVEQSPIGISFSRDGLTVDVNAAYLNMFGYENRDEVTGTPVIERIAPQSRAEVEARVARRSLGVPEENSYETIGLRKDGTQFPMFVSAQRVMMKDGPISSAFLIDFTERVLMQKSIDRISRLYKMLGDINSANIHIRDREKLFETACRIAVESGLFRMAWIGMIDHANGKVAPVAMAGHVDGYLDGLNINIYDQTTGFGPTAMSIKSGRFFGSNDIENDPRMAPWRNEALKRGYRSSIVFPLKQSGQIIGAFSLYFHEPGSLTEDVIQLLANLVEDISFTLDFIDEIARREQIQNELRELALFQQSALESERKRIARELHDELGQTMTALHFDLKWLNEHIAKGEHELRSRVDSMQGLLGRTVDTVRRISEDLRPGMLDDLGLAAAIEHHVQKFSAQAGIACDLAMSQTEFDLEEQIATTLFRIVQESLTNVARHSGASRATINLRELENKIFLIIQDNGRGLPSGQDSNRKTYGLLGMRERVRMMGGTLDIFNEPGAGVRIEACIPRLVAVKVLS